MSSKEHPGRVWSTAPPGASQGKKQVVIAGGPAPIHTRVTRRKHLRSVLMSRNYVWTLALLGGGGFLAASAITGDFMISAAIPAAVIVIGFVMAWFKAGKLASRDFFYGFALNHGLTYTPKLSLLETTPLLGAGERRRCEHYMEGPIAEDLKDIHAGLSLYVYETAEHRKHRRNQVVTVYTPHSFTICVVDLQRSMNSFPGVFLSQRGGLFGGDDWLDIDDLKTVELESSSLSSRYKLTTRRNQNMTRLLELFQPSFQVWLSELPFQICFEYSGGTLVTYVPKHLNDATSMEILLQTTVRIARRIIKEGEPLQVVTAGAGDVSDRFPAPPPATKPLIEGVPFLPRNPRDAPPD